MMWPWNGWWDKDPCISTFHTRRDNPKCVRGIIRKRTSKEFKDMLLPRLIRIYVKANKGKE